jgi:hypothetical protein
MRRLIVDASGRLLTPALVATVVAGCLWYDNRPAPDQDPRLPAWSTLVPGEYRGPSVEDFMRAKGEDPADCLDDPLPQV